MSSNLARRSWRSMSMMQNICSIKYLCALLNKGKNTEYGVKHLLNTTNSYEKFAQNVPVNTYEELKGDIDRMRHGEKDILWPGTGEMVCQVFWYYQR